MSDPALPTPVRTFLAAVSRGDADAAGALIAPGGVVHDEGERLDLTGPEETAAWVRSHLIPADVRLDPIGAEDAGDTLVVTTSVRATGAPPQTSAFRFVVAGDLLADVRITPPR